MKRPSPAQFFSELAREIYLVTWTLYKIMIPTILVVKVLEELGMLVYLGYFLSPAMELIGLPESMGIVWATTIMTNLYVGMLVFFDVAQTETLSIAQVTVLSMLLLVSHGLPIEARIAQRAGIRLGVTLLIRLVGALLLAWLAHQVYSAGNYLQQTNELVWAPEVHDTTLTQWLVSQLRSLFMILLIIAGLMTGLKILRLVGIERLLGVALEPLLRVMGIGREATTITIVGMTLGLSFGGGLLIREAELGQVSRRDIFSSLTMLALCHSLIEDTLLVMLLGAHHSGILWMRIVFTLVVLAIVTRWLRRRSDEFVDRWLFNRPRVDT
ncbi:MAG: hypothetical protein AB8B81_16730 [Halioglobus sp.]